jgi:2-polyprenyl-3-methyl-5-hydroxy-6-metoxy-1,4-benzoquinol methylase
MEGPEARTNRQARLLESQYGKNSRFVPPRQSVLRQRMFRFYSSRIDIANQLLRGGESLLDIGCGNGELILRASSRYKKLYGVDLIAHQVELSRERANQAGIGSAEFLALNVDSEFWPYPDNCFDTVTCIAALSHVLDPYHTVRECWRVLRPDGQFVVQIPNIAYVRRRIQLLFGGLPNTSYRLGWDGGTLRYFTLASLKKLLEENGFQTIRTSGSGMFAGLRNWWPSLLCPDVVMDARAYKESLSTKIPG